MSVSNGVKSSCEILNIATLTTHFTFDNGLFVNNSGPNSLSARTQSAESIPLGRYGQGITFNGSISSYFQASGLTNLGMPNKSFSISLWLRPSNLSGVVVHVSAQPSGFQGWAVPFLIFAGNGSLVSVLYNGNSHGIIIDPALSVSTSVWSHVVQTWSPTNGVRLYINNVLLASRLSLAMTYGGNGASMYVTLGNALNATGVLWMPYANTSPYSGDMDDFRVYSRELSSADICTLYTN